MAEKAEKAQVEAQEASTTEEAPVVSEAQANPEKFLKDFNWHNYQEGIDVIDNDLEDVMNGNLLFDIENSWSINGVKNGKLGVCAMKCGTEFDPFAEQFK